MGRLGAPWCTGTLGHVGPRAATQFEKPSAVSAHTGPPMAIIVAQVQIRHKPPFGGQFGLPFLGKHFGQSPSELVPCWPQRASKTHLATMGGHHSGPLATYWQAWQHVSNLGVHHPNGWPQVAGLPWGSNWPSATLGWPKSPKLQGGNTCIASGKLKCLGVPLNGF